jgi:hypothetical protein
VLPSKVLLPRENVSEKAASYVPSQYSSTYRWIKMTKQTKATKQPDSHYVSPESPQFEPTCVDENHAQIVEAHGVPMNADTTKDQTIRKHEPGVVELGGPDNRKTVRTKAGERHIQSEPGLKTAARRSTYVKQTRKEREKANFGS